MKNLTALSVTIRRHTAISRLFIAMVLMVSGGLTEGARAQEKAESREISVGYRVTPPFVMKDADGKLSGMAIELWEAIQDGLGYVPPYHEYSTVSDLLKATQANEIDVGIGAISITEERALKVDFTQPWFDSGLRVMVDTHSTSSLGNLWNGLADAGHLRFYGWLLFLMLAATIGLTIFDRRFDKNFPRRWHEGFAESFYAVMLVVTKGTLPSRTKLFGWYGRFFAAFWLVIGIAVVAYVTSSVTSVMTTIAIQGDITGPDDLPGHAVGVLKGSTAEKAATRANLDFIAYPNIGDAVAALQSNDVEALVGDAPVLEYYKFKNPDQGLDVVGRIFAPDKFGFALPYDPNSLIFPVTVKLLALQEDDFVKNLSQQYFGDER